MRKSTKYLMVLVGTVALIALALSVVAPAFAQTGTVGSTPQAGATVAVSDMDTLGSVVTQYALTGNNLRDFFMLNSGLILTSGQTINYPVGMTVDTSGQGQSTSSSTSMTVTDAQVLEFVTLNNGLTFTTGQSVILPAGVSASSASTPVATVAATMAATAAATATQSSATQANTYVTKSGDTLGTVLGFMGFQSIPATGANATTSGTSAAGGTTATATETSAAVGTTATATTAAGGTGTTATATETPAAVATTATATTAAGGTGTTATATPAAGVGATATATTAAGGTASTCASTYSTVAGDTLTAIAQRCGVTLEQLIAANPNLLVVGTSLNIPAASGNTSGGTSGSTTGSTSGSTGSTSGTTSGTTGSTGSIPQTGGSQAQSNPSGSFSGLNTNLMPADVMAGRGVYVVRKGDSLSSIARHFNTTVQWLLANNNGISNANLIYRGQHLVVPQGEFKNVWNYNQLERSFMASQNKTEAQTGDKPITP